MQTTNRLLDDLAKVASGAVSTATGLKGDVEALVRRQLDKLLAEHGLVSREEFEAVKAMAAKARAGHEALEKRLQALEAGSKKPAAAAKPKTRK